MLWVWSSRTDMYGTPFKVCSKQNSAGAINTARSIPSQSITIFSVSGILFLERTVGLIHYYMLSKVRQSTASGINLREVTAQVKPARLSKPKFLWHNYTSCRSRCFITELSSIKPSVLQSIPIIISTFVRWNRPFSIRDYIAIIGWFPVSYSVVCWNFVQQKVQIVGPGRFHRQ